MGDVDLQDLFRRPVVVAPMAGGPSTPALVAAAAEAGVAGFLAAGYRSADDVAGEIASVRARTDAAFGVNVFVPGAPTAVPDDLARYVASLDPVARSLGCEVGPAQWDDDDWEAKLALLRADPPPIVSFTFGCPDADVVHELQAAGSLVMGTVTTPGEAVRAAAAGVDVLCAQGLEAGAHRGTFANDDRAGQDYGLLALLGAVRQVTELPVVAAGGIMRRADVRAVLAAGAVAAQCGTAFLRCPDSGANAAHKAALADPAYEATVVTRAFSGRPARALATPFAVERRDAPAAYPEVHGATRPLRAAAAAVGDAGHLSLWAGQGFRLATDRPLGEVVELLCP